MPKLILTVEDLFQLTGRGLVLAPEVPEDAVPVTGNQTRFTALVRLVRPDSTRLHISAVIAVEFCFPGRHKWVCYPRGVTNADIPIGTEVWLLDHEGT